MTLGAVALVGIAFGLAARPAATLAVLGGTVVLLEGIRRHGLPTVGGTAAAGRPGGATTEPR